MSKWMKAVLFIVFASLAVWGFMLTADDPLLGPVVAWVIYYLPLIFLMVFGIAVCIAVWRLLRRVRTKKKGA